MYTSYWTRSIARISREPFRVHYAGYNRILPQDGPKCRSPRKMRTTSNIPNSTVPSAIWASSARSRCEALQLGRNWLIGLFQDLDEVRSMLPLVFREKCV